MSNNPSTTTKPIAFRVPNKVHAGLEQEAAKHKMKVSEYVKSCFVSDTSKVQIPAPIAANGFVPVTIMVPVSAYAMIEHKAGRKKMDIPGYVRERAVFDITRSRTKK